MNLAVLTPQSRKMMTGRESQIKNPSMENVWENAVIQEYEWVE